MDGITEAGVHTASRTVTRLEIDTGQEYEAFRDRYEDAVPQMDMEQAIGLIMAQPPWSQVVEVTATMAPHGFLLYWRLDTSPMFALAGHTSRCTSYLMGNHVIAERMFRHDPGAMLHAPLRTAIFDAPDGNARFAVDRPSQMFGALGRPEVDEVAAELDRKVGELLALLGVPVPAELAG